MCFFSRSADFPFNLPAEYTTWAFEFPWTPRKQDHFMYQPCQMFYQRFFNFPAHLKHYYLSIYFSSRSLDGSGATGAGSDGTGSDRDSVKSAKSSRSESLMRSASLNRQTPNYHNFDRL